MRQFQKDLHYNNNTLPPLRTGANLRKFRRYHSRDPTTEGTVRQSFTFSFPLRIRVPIFIWFCCYKRIFFTGRADHDASVKYASNIILLGGIPSEETSSFGKEPK